MSTRTRENEVVNEQTKKRVRPGPRKFGFAEGPLDHIMKLTLPGYRLYLANSINGKDLYRLQKLLDPTVGYEFVTPEEVSLKDPLGNPVSGDKIEVDVGGGIKAYLMKQPIEWAEEDLKEKERIADLDYHIKSLEEKEMNTQFVSKGAHLQTKRIK